MDIQVHPVQTLTDLEQFIRFPFRLYENDPNWVSPLLSEQRRLLSPKTNPYYQHAKVALWLARSSGRVVGTIASHVDFLHNRVHAEKAAMFGFFESEPDYDVAEALLATTSAWAHQQGMNTLRGPLSFSQNDVCGLLVEGQSGPPAFLMPYNPPYYADFFDRFGLTKAVDLYAYYVDLTQFQGDPHRVPSKLIRVAEAVRKRNQITIRHTSPRTYRDDLAKVKMVYNQAWKENWGFVPLTQAEFQDMENQLKRVYDPDLAIGAEIRGEPAGVAIALPDVNQMLKHVNGRLFPIGWMKALWHIRSISQSRLMILGVLEEYRGRGIEAALFHEIVKAAILKGHRAMEISWILETNDMMNRIIVNLGKDVGVRVYRTYRLYQTFIQDRPKPRST